MSGIELLISDSWGVYIPKHFAENFILWDGIEAEDREILEAGPEDSDWYWETWDSVLSKATYTDEKGNVWYLHQDGDLFAYCDALMDDEEYYNLFGEPRERAHQTDLWYDTSAELA